MFDAVQVFNAKGRLLLGFGEQGNQAGQFWIPNGMYIDGGQSCSSPTRITVASRCSRSCRCPGARPTSNEVQGSEAIRWIVAGWQAPHRDRCVRAARVPAEGAQTEIARTVHNLTPGGPGQLKETRPTGLCVYCHTPHNADPTIALWNRSMPAVTYQLYTSSTLQATPNQPTGSSRLCLSCHDGILALGNLRVPPPGEELKLGPMSGKRVLGTDLSDDHPISFVYDAELAVRHGELVDPRACHAPSVSTRHSNCNARPATIRMKTAGRCSCGCRTRAARCA